VRVAYEDAIVEAAGLYPDHNEWHLNPEYMRGVCDLIARLFALPDIHTDERADQVRGDIRAYISSEVAS